MIEQDIPHLVELGGHTFQVFIEEPGCVTITEIVSCQHGHLHSYVSLVGAEFSFGVPEELWDEFEPERDVDQDELLLCLRNLVIESVARWN